MAGLPVAELTAHERSILARLFKLRHEIHYCSRQTHAQSRRETLGKRYLQLLQTFAAKNMASDTTSLDVSVMNWNSLITGIVLEISIQPDSRIPVSADVPYDELPGMQYRRLWIA